MASSVDIQGLQFEISTKTSDSQMTKGINDYANALKKIGEKSQGASKGLQTLNDALSKVKNIDKLAQFAESLGKLGEVKISPSIAKNITAIGDAVSRMTDENLGKLQQFTDALANLKGVDLNVGSGGKGKEAQETTPTTNIGGFEAIGEKVTSRFPALGEVAGSAGTALQGFLAPFKAIAPVAIKVGGAIGTITGKFAKLVSVVGGSVLSASVKTFTSALGKFSLNPARAITGLTSKFGNLLSSIKRIAMYRAIRFFFAQLARAMREGINNLYQYSAVMGGTFKQSMDSLATSFLYLKNSMGAMVSPLINALAPAVEYIIDKFVALINIVNQFFAALTGKKTTTVARRVATTFKEASDSAGDTAGGISKAAKELKRSILGFDEINALNAPDKGSSGSGGGSGSGGASSPDYSDMFETIDVDSGISDWVQDLKDAFDKGDWKTLGTMLGEKFNDLVNYIPWADFGAKVGSALSGAISTAYYFFETADFENLGKKIGEFLNEATEKMLEDSGDGTSSFYKLGALFTAPFRSLGSTIIGLIEEIDTEQIGTAFHDFFTGLFNSLTKWLKSYEWEDLGSTVYQKIKGFFAGLQGGDIAQSISTFLGTAIKSAGEFIEGFVGDLVNDFVSTWNTRFTENKNKGLSTVSAFIETAFSFVFDAAKWVEDNIINPFVRAITGDENWDASTVAKKIGGKIKGFFTDALNFFTSPVTWVVDNIITPFTKAFGDSNNWSFPDIGATIKEKALKALGGIKNNAINFTANVTAKFTQGFNNVKKTWENFKKNSTAVKTIKGKIGAGWTTVKTAWNSVKNKTASLRARITGGASGIINAIHKKWQYLKNNAMITFRARFMGRIGDAVKSAWNTFARGYNAVRSKINSFASSLHIGISLPEAHPLARGGIVSGATNALIGEAGKEAVLPLERNLGWQRTLAEQLVAKMGGMNTQSDNSDMIYHETVRQNELLAQQNRLLTQILEKDPEIKLSTTSIQEGLARKNLRDGKTTVPVY